MRRQGSAASRRRHRFPTYARPPEPIGQVYDEKAAGRPAQDVAKGPIWNFGDYSVMVFLLRGGNLETLPPLALAGDGLLASLPESCASRQFCAPCPPIARSTSRHEPALDYPEAGLVSRRPLA